MARKLRLLAIEDDEFHRLPDIELVGTITGLKSAQEYWGGENLLPDLITSDVLFASDQSTPLSKIPVDTSHAHIAPTGLSHLKPFLVLGRNAKHLGIGIKTAHTDLWAHEKLSSHPMVLLAAHEIMEISAILGDPVHAIDECWEWLREHSDGEHATSQSSALSDFRRKLIVRSDENSPQFSPVILPDSSWFKTLDTLESLISADEEEFGDAIINSRILEQSITLLSPSGERDPILLRSIFADSPDFKNAKPADFKLQSFAQRYFLGQSQEKIDQILGDQELSSAFEEQERRFSGNLQSAPAVGVFLKLIGRFPQAYGEAVDLTQGRTQDTGNHLVRAVAAFLARVKISFERQQSQLTIAKGVDREDFIFFLSKQRANSIEGTWQPTLSYFDLTKRVFDIICDQDSYDFEIAETLSISLHVDTENTPHTEDGKALVGVIDRLVQRDHIMKNKDNAYTCLRKTLAIGDLMSQGKKISTADVGSILGVSDTQLHYSIGSAFGGLGGVERNEKNVFRSAGTDIKKRYWRKPPIWLSEVMQSYAETELNWESNLWPKWLKNKY